MITYEQIAATIEELRLIPISIVNATIIDGKYEEEITAIQFYFPSIIKEEGMQHLRNLFADELDIRYLSNQQMMEIKIPSLAKVVNMDIHKNVVLLSEVVKDDLSHVHVAYPTTLS